MSWIMNWRTRCQPLQLHSESRQLVSDRERGERVEGHKEKKEFEMSEKLEMLFLAKELPLKKCGDINKG